MENSDVLHCYELRKNCWLTSYQRFKPAICSSSLLVRLDPSVFGSLSPVIDCVISLLWINEISIVKGEFISGTSGLVPDMNLWFQWNRWVFPPSFSKKGKGKLISLELTNCSLTLIQTHKSRHQSARPQPLSFQFKLDHFIHLKFKLQTDYE